MAGIADEKEFWVRIVNNDGDYDVVEVRRVKELAEVGVKAGRNMQPLKDLREMLIQNDEYITEVQSVEIRIMRIQTEKEIEAGVNKKCVVNRREYSC